VNVSVFVGLQHKWGKVLLRSGPQALIGLMEGTNGFLHRSKPTSDVIIGRTQRVFQISGSEQIVVVETDELWKALCHDSQ
jgi:hypothetical protein